jgi:DNA-directed RNA polymerase specialized sigma24 family protein
LIFKRGDKDRGRMDATRTLVAGIHELSLPIRSALELRYRRGLSVETIAEVAQTDIAEIEAHIRTALNELAGHTGDRGPYAIKLIERDLEGLSPAGWAGDTEQL